MKRHHLMALLGAAGTVIAQPAAAQTFVTYQCRDGSEIGVAFFPGDRAAHVQVDGKALALPRRVSITGARYSKGYVSLTIKKTAVTLKRGKRTTECTAS